MRPILTSLITDEAILAKPVYNSEGNILLDKKMVLKKSYVHKLEKIGISKVYIEDRRTDDIIIQDVIAEETRVVATKYVRAVLQKIEMIREIDRIKIDTNAVHDIAKEMIRELSKNRNNLAINLMEVKTFENYTAAHCVNSAVLSLTAGLQMNLNEEDMEALGEGELMHDIGKALISKKILDKPDRLTPEEFKTVQEHSILGYAILSKQENIKARVAWIALQHHEKYNGKGYPYGLNADGISPLAKISAVADVYDALVSDRIYKKAIPSYMAIKFIVGAVNDHFSPEVVNLFLKFIAPYPKGTFVELSNGTQGIIKDLKPSSIDKPVVRILKDNGTEIQGNFPEINLENTSDILIVKTIDNI